MNDEQNKTAQTKGGMIPEGFYPWWLGGVLAGGVVVSIVAATAMEGITPGAAWGGGLASAVVFLFCLDTRGNFRWAAAIPAIAVLVIAANVYHQSTGRPIPAIGGILGFIVYSVFGFIGVGIGKLI